MVTLQPMSDSDFLKYLDFSVKDYAAEKVKAGTWPEEGSYEKAENEFRRLLPKGKDTEKNYLYNVMDGHENVGNLWLGIIPKGGDFNGLFIWDIVLYPEFRGKGLGKQTMIALEEKARELGENKITLHVFGHNEVAIGLYRKSGYKVTDLIMAKELQ